VKKGHRDIDIVLMDEDYEELEVVYPGFAYDAEVSYVWTLELNQNIFFMNAQIWHRPFKRGTYFLQVRK
jgi:hypothetical protein